MKKLKRKWSYRVTALFAAAVVVYVAGELLVPLVGTAVTEDDSLQGGFRLVAVVLAFAALWFLHRHLRCPYCGSLSVNIWQKKGEHGICSRCGRTLVFDDDPPEPNDMDDPEAPDGFDDPEEDGDPEDLGGLGDPADDLEEPGEPER